MKRIYAVIFAFLIFGRIFPGEPIINSFTANDYISNYRSKAISEMLLHGIPASITLAQGMIESGNGNSNLARSANNHFGIKCHKEWSGPTFTMDDDEKNECFRKYENVLDSYSDHSYFLVSRPRYCFLFQLPKTDYIAWARGLKSAGYATHPQYAEKLIGVIEANHLYDLDTIKTFIEDPNDISTEEKQISYSYFSRSTENLLGLLKKHKIFEELTKRDVSKSENIEFSEHLLVETSSLTEITTKDSFAIERIPEKQDQDKEVVVIEVDQVAGTSAKEIKNFLPTINHFYESTLSIENPKDLSSSTIITETKRTVSICKNSFFTERSYEVKKEVSVPVLTSSLNSNTFDEGPFMELSPTTSDANSVYLLQDAINFLRSLLIFGSN